MRGSNQLFLSLLISPQSQSPPIYTAPTDTDANCTYARTRVQTTDYSVVHAVCKYIGLATMVPISLGTCFVVAILKQVPHQRERGLYIV